MYLKYKGNCSKNDIFWEENLNCIKSESVGGKVKLFFIYIDIDINAHLNV